MKYELTDNTIVLNGKNLYQIRALVDIAGTEVKAGDLGGYLQSEDNLSHDGKCWLDETCFAYENAKVYGNAEVKDHVRITGNAEVFDDAKVEFGSFVADNARVGGRAFVSDRSIIAGNTNVSGWARMEGVCMIGNHAKTNGHIYDGIFGVRKMKDRERVSSEILRLKKAASEEYSEEPKYELTDNTVTVDGHTLYQIRALRDFDRLSHEYPKKELGAVKTGDLGGYIESEANLSHNGGCWVKDNACVYENARVAENAWMIEDAKVSGNVIVTDHGVVKGNAKVNGNAVIAVDGWVSQNADVSENALCLGGIVSGTIKGNVLITESGSVSDYAVASGNAIIKEDASVREFAAVDGNAVITGWSKVRNFAHVGGTATIHDSDIQGHESLDSGYYKDSEIGDFLGKDSMDLWREDRGKTSTSMTQEDWDDWHKNKDIYVKKSLDLLTGIAEFSDAISDLSDEDTMQL